MKTPKARAELLRTIVRGIWGPEAADALLSWDKSQMGRLFARSDASEECEDLLALDWAALKSLTSPEPQHVWFSFWACCARASMRQDREMLRKAALMADSLGVTDVAANLRRNIERPERPEIMRLAFLRAIRRCGSPEGVLVVVDVDEGAN